ncbi:MAG: YeeE/YedE family protein [Deltaproteobacteria bacterium]|nr:MAG: YeeE/YedE family protein [Deltaproteobacteria bacterium]
MNLYEPLAGGALIGLAASLLWVVSGRIAGISGIVGQLLARDADGRRWRWSFLGGLALGGALLGWLDPSRVAPLPDTDLATVLVAGVLVGVGTRLANGCTSGHGVCGIPRGSTRSGVSTGLYIGVGMLVTAWLGGAR